MSWPLQVYLLTLALILKVRVLIHTFGSRWRVRCLTRTPAPAAVVFMFYSCADTSNTELCRRCMLVLESDLRLTCDLNFTLVNPSILLLLAVLIVLCRLRELDGFPAAAGFV